MLDRNPTPWRARRLVLYAAGVLALGCAETVTQVSESDVVDLRISADSGRVGVGRTLQVRAYPLDATGALLVGQDIGWRSGNPQVATVDDAGLVTGVAVGTTEVLAEIRGLVDTTFLTVDLPPILTLSIDSAGFQTTAGGADPPPQTVDVTNAGVFDLVDLTVDSIVYESDGVDWLTGELDSTEAPATLTLGAASASLTSAGTFVALVWLSATDAEGSPVAVTVTLEIGAGEAAAMTSHDGDGQAADAGSAVPVAPAVLVVDAFGNPVSGVQVGFAVTGGGGDLTGAAAVTDSDGVARVESWTLGLTAGANEVTASFGALEPVVFTATGLTGPPAQVVVTAGNDQSAVAGSAVPTAPSVSVRDEFGNGVAGVAVTFSVASGGGAVTGAGQTTDAQGGATVGSWTLGTTAGPNTLSVSAEGVPTPATVSATGLGGDPVAILLVAGDAQSDTVGATLPVAYAVKVVDTNDNGVAEVPVTWQVTGGGGSFTASTSVTDAQGVATSARVLGTAPGSHTATASVGGLTAVEFAAGASVGSPDQIRIVAGNNQSATVNTTVTTDPKVVVEDKFDNPIEGHTVTFSVQSGGGTVSPTTAITTLADGTAKVTSWKLGTASGTNNNSVRATASGPGIAGDFVTFTATATADNPTSFTIVSGNNQTSVTGTNVSTSPRVRLRDQYDNPVSGRTVSFSASGSGSVGSGSVQTNGSGEASTNWVVNVGGHSMGTNGTYQNTLTASTSGFNSIQFAGFARYSYPTHVNPLWSGPVVCTGCHGASGNLALTGSAAQNHSALYDEAPFCDGSLATSGYRRVSPTGGATGADKSMLLVFLDPALPNALGNCAHPVDLSNYPTELQILRSWVRNGAPNN